MDFMKEYPLLGILIIFALLYITFGYLTEKRKQREQKRQEAERLFRLECAEQAQREEAERQYKIQQQRLMEIRQKDEEKSRQINECIDNSMSVLKNKYRQLAYKDDYGIVKTERFEHEIDYFLEKVINKNNILTPQNKKDLKDTIINYMLHNIDVDDIDLNDTNPYNFEKQCANVLKEYGWDANTTPKSSDQGVDVIATKNGKTVAIQCKLYSKPVGNKAVQEVNTGKSYYKADYAVVVSNNTYTSSARQLAKNCGVLLLFYDDLKNLDKTLNI